MNDIEELSLMSDLNSEQYNIYTEESNIDIIEELESYLRQNSGARFCTDPSWMN